MDEQQLKTFLDFACELAEQSGEVLKKYWGKLSSIEEKNFSWDLVTEADKESEIVILGKIQREYPNHAILSEEAGFIATSQSQDYCWVVDPLDGTTNYTHQYPMVSISIALMYHQTPVVGVVYNPILNEFFQAATGLGCQFNHKPTYVSKVDTLDRSLLATGFAYNRRETEDNNYAEFCHMTNMSQGVRRGGSAALDLAYVAAGRLDGFWERGLKIWDIAAGIVCVNEAGGRVTSYQGNAIDLNSGRILASNGLLHQNIINGLKSAKLPSSDSKDDS